MKTVAIIQARMGSTRLPGKIMKTIFGKTLLEYQIERVKQCNTIDQIVIATTKNEKDDLIVEFCEKLALPFYRGSEEDVLSRYYEAAIKYKADTIVRLTSDCPVIDPEIIDQVVHSYLQNQDQFDYISNTLVRSYPRGMDTEVMSFVALSKAFREAINENFREHVTAFIYNHPQDFRISNVMNNNDLSRFRLTVDTQEDFKLIENIIKTLYPNNPLFKLSDIISLLNEKPEWTKINAHIEQKKV